MYTEENKKSNKYNFYYILKHVVLWGLMYKIRHSSRNGERQYWPLSSLYRYEVLPNDSEKSKSLTTVSADVIHRKKTFYSRAKNRLYIKQFTEQVDGFWKLKVCII